MAESLLDRILAPGALTVVFQPIFQRRADGWELHAFEALVRGPRGTNMECAEVLFEYVRRKRAEPDVDRVCIAEVLRAATLLGPDARLGFNVHAVTLEQDPGFPDFLERAVAASPFHAAALTLEIVEHSPSWSGRRFAAALTAVRELGFSIALDDVGLGHSNYRMILECSPDYFKIDRYLVSGSSGDFHRRAVLRSIVELAGSFGAYAVAEGVDNVNDLTAVLGEGIAAVQGFLLAEPAPAAVLGTGAYVRSAARRFPTAGTGRPWADATNWLALLNPRRAPATVVGGVAVS